jgi:hypothetical protein
MRVHGRIAIDIRPAILRKADAPDEGVAPLAANGHGATRPVRETRKNAKAGRNPAGGESPEFDKQQGSELKPAARVQTRQ